MFVYEMAYNLRMTVEEVNQMTQKEFLGWCQYFKVRPPEWRQDQRTAMICQSNGVKAKAEELFPSLNSVFEESRKKEAYQKRKLINNAFFQMAAGEHEAYQWLKE